MSATIIASNGGALACGRCGAEVTGSGHVCADLAALLRACDEALAARDAAEAECARLRAALTDLAAGREHVQCLVARIGEGTLECRAETPCAACLAAHRCALLRAGSRRAADLERVVAERDAALAVIAGLRAAVRRYLDARATEARAKAAWVAGHADEAQGIGDEYAGPLTTAYDDAQDERIVALKLLAQAVAP